MTHKSHHPETLNELSVAESFVLLSLEWPVKVDPMIAWSDADFGLVGALLIDLSLAGRVDSDLRNLTLLERKSRLEPAPALAMTVLKHLGRTIPLDVAINALTDRVGDLVPLVWPAWLPRKFV